MTKQKKNKMTLKVEKQKVEECFTCPICNNLYDCATTISECLHTFCRKCIRYKLIEENLKACPVCNVDLGVAPLDKLRMDNNLEDMRLKLFQPKPENVKAVTETIETALSASKKKKNSLSSLLATSLRISSSPESNHVAPLEPDEKLGEQVEACTQIQSLSKPIPKFRKRDRKNPRPKRINAGLVLEQPLKEAETDFKILLNTAGQENGLVSKTVKSRDTAVILGPETNQNGKEIQDNLLSSGGNTEENSGEKSEKCVEVNPKCVLSSVEINLSTVLISSGGDTEEISGEKLKKKGKKKQEHVHSSGKNSGYSPAVLRPRRRCSMTLSATPQVSDPMEEENQVETSNNKPVWFSLVASENQNKDRPLPQISPGYLRVANGNLPASYVKKYLVKKLCLDSEDEVEIRLRHEPVCSTLKLQSLVDWWFHTTPISERKGAMVGSSGADFVMVLFYSRSHLCH